MPRDITHDRYEVVAVQPDGSDKVVPHISLAWEHPAAELPLRLRVQVPNVATDEWDPSYVSEGIFWRLQGGPPDSMLEISRGRFLGHGTGLNPGEPIQPRGYDLMFSMLKSRIDCFYDDQASAAYIIADLCGQWGVPVDFAHFDGPQSVVGPMYGQRKQIADIFKACLQRARDLGEGDWVLRWGPAGITSYKPGNNTTVYWFVEGESVFGGSFDFSVEDMITRVRVMRPAATTGSSPVQNILTGRFDGSTKGEKHPASLITTVDGHIEFGVVQDIVYAKRAEADDEATARAQAYINSNGVPTITLTLITPLLHDINKGDRHRCTLPTIGFDGYMFVEGLSCDEGSRTMHLTMSTDYHDLFSAQQGPPPDFQDDSSTEPDAVDKLGAPGLGTAGKYNPNTPALKQTHGWSCSATSVAWMLQATGHTASETDTINFLGAGINSEVGLTHADGSGIVSMLQQHYNLAADNAAVTFDDVLAKAGQQGMCMGGNAWNHWTGVAAVIDRNTIKLANPAPGWMGISDTMTRDQFARLGPFHAVWVRAGAAGGNADSGAPAAGAGGGPF